MRILIVEDDPHTATFIAKGLGEDGHTVDQADNGRDGLFLATTETYDAIVLDRMLPGVDGLTVLRTLRGSGNATPVLLLTALGDVDHRVEDARAIAHELRLVAGRRIGRGHSPEATRETRANRGRRWRGRRGG